MDLQQTGSMSDLEITDPAIDQHTQPEEITHSTFYKVSRVLPLISATASTVAMISGFVILGLKQQHNPQNVIDVFVDIAKFSMIASASTLPIAIMINTVLNCTKGKYAEEMKYLTQDTAQGIFYGPLYTLCLPCIIPSKIYNLCKQRAERQKIQFTTV